MPIKEVTGKLFGFKAMERKGVAETNSARPAP
jgi:hypothetical protein